MQSKYEMVIERAYNKYESAVLKLSDTWLAQVLSPARPQPDCQRSIICQCERRSCPAYTVTIQTFTRRLKDLWYYYPKWPIKILKSAGLEKPKTMMA